jgi:hypothetical protein
MGIKAIVVIGAVLLIIIGCAMFRVNLWTLLPWHPGTPRRFDDGIDQPGIARHSANKPDKRS